MLTISSRVEIPEEEVELHAIRAQGAGGQNVNKLATAIHLQFDIRASSLPAIYKTRLLKLADRRISKDGIITIKAQQFRSQEKNRADALSRLVELIRRAAHTPRQRIPTKVPLRARQQRLDRKNRQARTKALRKKVRADLD